jgi:hypothetical protein
MLLIAASGEAHTCFGSPSQKTLENSSDGKLASAQTAAVASGGLSSSAVCPALPSLLLPQQSPTAAMSSSLPANAADAVELSLLGISNLTPLAARIASRASATDASLGLPDLPSASSLTAPKLDRTADPADLACRDSSVLVPLGLGLSAGEAVRDPARDPAREPPCFIGDSEESLPAAYVAPGLLHALLADRDLWLPGPRGSSGMDAACRLRRKRY